jgi:uncharacterized sodium:solute symporter family permease YidK
VSGNTIFSRLFGAISCASDLLNVDLYSCRLTLPFFALIELGRGGFSNGVFQMSRLLLLLGRMIIGFSKLLLECLC